MATVNPNRIKTDSNGRKYIVVIKGDNLWSIAEAYYGSGQGAKYTTLVAINKLQDPDYIVVGQTIYLTAATGSGSSGSSDAQRVTITQFGLLADDGSREIYAAWTWPKTGDTDHYEIEWRYKLAIWIYSDATTDRLYSTFTPPDNSAIKEVQFRVKPIAKKDENSNGASTSRFSATWSDWKSYSIVNKPDVPSGLSVSLSDLTLNVSLDNVDASLVEFQLVKDNNETTAKSNKWSVNTGHVSGTFTVAAGAVYKVRCRAYKDGLYSEWSGYSQNCETRPTEVALNDPVAKSKSSIYLEWSKSPTAEKYKIEGTGAEGGFISGASIAVTAETDAANYTATGLESGLQYYFRVKAIKGQEESDWSEVKSVIIGTGPIQPTTWSSTTTATVGEGESVVLYWVHNTEDGSSQTYADVKLQIEGIDDINAVVRDVSVEIGEINWDETVIDTDTNTVTYRVDNSTKDSEKDKTHSLIINTENYEDGAIITWNVCTAGITNVQGEASADRIVEIYNTPTVYLTVTDASNAEVGATYYKVDVLEAADGAITYLKTPETIEKLEGAAVAGAFAVTGEQVRLGIADNGDDVYFCIIEASALGSFPFNVTVTVDEVNTAIQYPIGYHLSLIANEMYDTVDNFGNAKVVTAGEVVYSKHFDHPAATLEPLAVSISAQDVSLENGQTYTVKCSIAMSSGILVEASTEITVSWTSMTYQINAEIGIDSELYSAYIRPYCEVADTIYRKIDKVGSVYYLTADTYEYVYGSAVNGVTTFTGEQVYSGTIADGSEVFYSLAEASVPVTSVLLSVYRREFDGSFTEIIADLDGANNSFVTDPHPALDYARYRIVAKDKLTGKVGYYDLPNYPVGEKAIIIQWAEPQSSFSAADTTDEALDKSQSVLRLPYNIDISDARAPDVSLVEYIGRKHPVSYYGTQLGEKSTWSTVIEKSDMETIYALRRLSVWTGDVYVREPYGTGYWANVKVSFGQNHLETTIPVNFDITRVEGGI